MGNGNFRLLLDTIEAGENSSVFGLNRGEKLAVVDGANFLFYVVDNIDEITPIYESLMSLGKRCEILTQPMDIFSSEFASAEVLLKTLYKLKNEELDALILTPEMLTQKVIDKDKLFQLNIKVGDEIRLSDLLKDLIKMGYKRVDLVSNVGEFSLRGDIIDIYPLMGEPTRIVFDFDIVESIKLYNSVTMLASKSLNTVQIPLVKFYNVNEKSVERFYEKLSKKRDSAFYEICDSIDSLNYLNIMFDEAINSTLLDYATDGVIAFDGARNIYEKLSKYILEYNDKIKSYDGIVKNLISSMALDIKKVLNYPKSLTLLAFQSITEANRLFSPKRVFSIRTLPRVNYVRHTNVLGLDLGNYARLNYTVILCGGDEERCTRLESDLNKLKINYVSFDRVFQCQAGAINILKKTYPLDILLPEEKLVVISTTSLFGERKKIVDGESVNFESEAPKYGDYVVHSVHGVGKCLGVETLKLSDGYRDYIIIEYRDNGKLYLPVENLDQVTKFLGKEEAPTLNRLGGTEFAKTKEKTRQAVKKIAFDLIALYRERFKAKGYKYSVDTDMQIDFENSFPFTETIDQRGAINDCKADMENGRVMDRLVCGDVGFGKTEVALRVAFKTILDGKQVAFLCPTTILSEQHYNTALSRMSDFGVKVAVLNKLRTPKQIEQVKKDIGEGKIDLVVGTQKLLANDINYKNLGLLILDEEQKFGVADKEKIKNIKKHVNVLTLSATPIPRTLNMALVGIRDISVISTPPVQRQSVQVSVCEFSDTLLKDAISRELDRDGQVLIVYNRVEDINRVASHISSLFPSVKVSIGHGQMSAEELEKEIFNLYSKKTQIFVSTTIIENGVDLPNANTIIVLNSDNFGLSQLYQLKGRVGRSDRLAFAYFTFDKSKCLSENAYKRLEAIEEFSEMGSGYKIAMRDLEIRGAGSILGAEQSGHIEKVGYNMYVQMLGDSIKELKGEEVESVNEVRVETSLSAYLSKNYVPSVGRRMSMYKDIASINSMEKLSEFLNTTKEVYGEPPIELINLCKISYIKNMAGRIKANRVIIKREAKIILQDKDAISENILTAIDGYVDNVSLDLSKAPSINVNGVGIDKVLDFLIAFLQLV